MYLLVGFVNQVFTPRLCLGILNLENEQFHWVADDQTMLSNVGVCGVNGLMHLDGRILVGYQSQPTKIVVLDEILSVISSFEVPALKDTHSFAVLDDKILAAASSTDEIHSLEMDERLGLRSSSVWWRHPGNKKRRDEYHVNSVAVLNGDVLATCFGKKSPEGWSKTTQGQLLNLSTQQTLLNDIHHPHTVYRLDDGWILCESGTGQLITQDGRKHLIGGYIRGIAHDDRYLYIGISGRRLISRSEGTLNAPQTSDRLDARSAVQVIDRQTFEPVRRIDLGDYGTEIYDMLLFEGNSLPNEMFQHDPLQTKLEHMETRIMQLEAESQNIYSKAVRKMLLDCKRCVASLIGK